MWRENRIFLEVLPLLRRTCRWKWRKMKKEIKYKIVISALVILISALHYFVGSSDSPVHNFYRLLYYIPIILASFIFGFRGGVIVSLIVGIIYSPFILLSFGGFGWQTVNELLNVGLFFCNRYHYWDSG